MTKTCPVCTQKCEENASVCSACGFTFNGETREFAPVHLPLKSEEVPAASNRDYGQFKIIRGPYSGAVISLMPGELTIGRAPTCEIFLNDMTVSRKHAKLQVSKDAIVLIDEHSFNGVWVNDKLIDTITLSSGDKIQIGEFCLYYTR